MAYKAPKEPRVSISQKTYKKLYFQALKMKITITELVEKKLSK